MKVQSAGDYRCFVVDLERGQTFVLDDFEGELLQNTNRFRSLAGHARRMMELGWEDDGSGFIENAFSRLADLGLLRFRTDFLHSMPTGDADPCEITTVVWPTRNRLPILARGINSWVTALGKYSRAPRLLVVDDSNTPLTTAGLADALSSEAAHYAGPIALTNRDQVGTIGSELTTCGIPRPVVEFGLHGSGAPGDRYGANRNRLVLATVGELILSADDDTVCTLAAPKAPINGVQFYSFFDPTHFSFYGDRESLMAAVTAVEEDPLAAHEQLLGVSPASILERTGAPPNLTSVHPRFAADLTNLETRTRVTVAGTCGDSGMASSKKIINLRGTLRTHLENGSDYQMARGAREILRCANQPVVSEGPFFMGGCFALDNRDDLPPFFPTLRDEDGAWGLTLRTALRTALIGHVPRAIFHLPETGRSHRPDTVAEFEPRFPEFLRLLVLSYSDHPRENNRNGITALGDYLVGLADLPSREFDSFLRSRWTEQMSGSIDYLEQLLVTYDNKPVEWAEDVTARIDAVRAYAESDRFGAPAELAGTVTAGSSASDIDHDSLRRTLVRLVRSYGELLHWWPAMLECAREARSAGKW